MLSLFNNICVLPGHSWAKPIMLHDSSEFFNMNKKQFYLLLKNKFYVTLVSVMNTIFYLSANFSRKNAKFIKKKIYFQKPSAYKTNSLFNASKKETTKLAIFLQKHTCPFQIASSKE